MDGAAYTHCHSSTVPGTVALPLSAHSVTAAHELGHALGSYENGQIVDLYNDWIPQPGLVVNKKNGRSPGGPIPSQFATYNDLTLASDPTGSNPNYLASWTTYHCQRIDPVDPALMDNYWPGTPPESCCHDAITRRFLHDRLLAKISR